MIGAWIARRKLRRGFAALEAHDFDTFMQNFDDDVVFIYPGDIDGVSGAHRGREAVRDFFDRWAEQFPIVHFDVKEVMLARSFALAGTNTMAVESAIEVTNKQGDEGSAELVTVIELRRGRVVRIQDYVFDTGDVMSRAWSRVAEGQAT
ncbi:MAG: nuclear transport factor 2 family protein [Candidatus Longimicrobiales bacterium M2_2A_002]